MFLENVDEKFQTETRRG